LGYRTWLRIEENRMNPKKQKAKDRRRASVHAEQAWEAANQGKLDLAEKIIRRAVSTQEDNPVLWNDQGVILGLRDKDGEAAKSFAAALTLAPTFADPYAYLAALRLRQGRVEEALGPQAQAAKYAPQNAPYPEQLKAYQALAGRSPPHADSPAAATVEPSGSHRRTRATNGSRCSESRSAFPRSGTASGEPEVYDADDGSLAD
jgi:Flp pilus assembly protein TadD